MTRTAMNEMGEVRAINGNTAEGGCLSALARLVRIAPDERGSITIEMAFLIPVLLALSLGGFEVSSMVARQSELQSAAAEAAAVARAVSPQSAEERTTVRDIMVTSTGLTNDQVTITEVYRCGTAANYETTSGNCEDDVVENRFIQIDLSDRYDPIWKKWGVGSGFDYNVSRTVQIG